MDITAIKAAVYLWRSLFATQAQFLGHRSSQTQKLRPSLQSCLKNKSCGYEAITNRPAIKFSGGRDLRGLVAGEIRSSLLYPPLCLNLFEISIAYPPRVSLLKSGSPCASCSLATDLCVLVFYMVLSATCLR